MKWIIRTDHEGFLKEITRSKEQGATIELRSVHNTINPAIKLRLSVYFIPRLSEQDIKSFILNLLKCQFNSIQSLFSTRLLLQI